MYAERNKQFHQGPAVERLARESHVSIDDVARLYADELAKLEVGARIQGFLPIFAIRKVREMLRKSSTSKLRLAHARGAWNKQEGLQALVPELGGTLAAQAK